MKTCVTLLLLSGAVLALPVPVETADGLTLRIEGVDPLPPKEGVDRRSKANLGAPVRDASVPMPLAFVVSNGTARSVSGRLSAWMNDDWTVEGVPQEEIAPVRDLLVSEMENVIQLSIPLTVECHEGKTWLEAH